MSFNILNIIYYKDNCRFPVLADKLAIRQRVDDIRRLFDISLQDYPIDIFKVLKQIEDIIEVKTEMFDSKNLGGFIIYNQLPDKSYIILNEKQP